MTDLVLTRNVKKIEDDIERSKKDEIDIVTFARDWFASIPKIETHCFEIYLNAFEKFETKKLNYTADSVVGIIEFKGKNYSIEIKEEKGGI